MSDRALSLSGAQRIYLAVIVRPNFATINLRGTYNEEGGKPGSAVFAFFLVSCDHHLITSEFQRVRQLISLRSVIPALALW